MLIIHNKQKTIIMGITKRPQTMKIELALTDSHVIVIALKNRKLDTHSVDINVKDGVYEVKGFSFDNKEEAIKKANELIIENYQNNEYKTLVATEQKLTSKIDRKKLLTFLKANNHNCRVKNDVYEVLPSFLSNFLISECNFTEQEALTATTRENNKFLKANGLKLSKGLGVYPHINIAIR